MTRMLFKQRFFSWFDSYDIYDENDNVMFIVKGKLSWGHRLEIYNAEGRHLGTVKEEVLSFLQRFSIYFEDQKIGEIKKQFTLFKPVFTLNCRDWVVEGDLFGWDYQVIDSNNKYIMQASKQLFNLTDTYIIDVAKEEDVLLSLMIVLAIDAAKCSNDD